MNNQIKDKAIEEIIKKTINLKKRREEYKIKWKNNPKKEWVPFLDLIDHFDEIKFESKNNLSKKRGRHKKVVNTQLNTSTQNNEEDKKKFFVKQKPIVNICDSFKIKPKQNMNLKEDDELSDDELDMINIIKKSAEENAQNLNDFKIINLYKKGNSI